MEHENSWFRTAFPVWGIQGLYFSMLCFSEHWKSMWQDSREHRRMGALCFAVRPAGSDRKLLWMQQKGICSKLISLVCALFFSGSYTTSVRHAVLLNVAFQKMMHIEFLKCDTFVGATVSCQCSSLLVCTCVLGFTKMALVLRTDIGIKNTNWTIGVFMIFGVIKSWMSAFSDSVSCTNF